MRAFGGLGALVVAAFAVVGLLALIGVFDDGSSSAAARGDGFSERGRINRIYDRASPGVVFIQAEVARPSRWPAGPQPRRGVATGTGFVIDRKG
jgi:hypothetical protein